MLLAYSEGVNIYETCVNVHSTPVVLFETIKFLETSKQEKQ